VEDAIGKKKSQTNPQAGNFCHLPRIINLLLPVNALLLFPKRPFPQLFRFVLS